MLCFLSEAVSGSERARRRPGATYRERTPKCKHCWRNERLIWLDFELDSGCLTFGAGSRYSRKLNVEFEFEVRNAQFRRPETENYEKRIQKNKCLMCCVSFHYLFICS